MKRLLRITFITAWVFIELVLALLTAACFTFDITPGIICLVITALLSTFFWLAWRRWFADRKMNKAFECAPPTIAPTAPTPTAPPPIAPVKPLIRSQQQVPTWQAVILI